jgi:hypothetical protein
MLRSQPRPQVVPGTVIPLCEGKACKAVGACFLAFLIAVGWFVLGWMHRTIFVSAAVLAVVIFVCLLFLVLLTLVRLATGQRLVIGSDRLQIVQGAETIVAQIPYRNIAGLASFTYSWRKFLGFDLANPHDAETFWSWGQRGNSYGFHFILADSYAEALDDIRNRILTYFQAWETRAPERRWEGQ